MAFLSLVGAEGYPDILRGSRERVCKWLHSTETFAELTSPLGKAFLRKVL